MKIINTVLLSNKKLKGMIIMRKLAMILLITQILGLNLYSFAEENGWTKRSDIPAARYGHSSSVVNGKIYVIGGTTDWQDIALSTVEEYDPLTDTWTRKHEMPTARWALSTSVVDGKIYAIGGTKGEKLISTVEMYDPAIDKWAKKSDMPIERASFATSAVNGKIYAFGGFNYIKDGVTVTSIVEEYDPIMDRWIIKNDMPIARANLCSITLRDKIYVIGGMNENCEYLTLVEEYDPITHKWSEKSSMPTARVDSSIAELDGKIYVLGGWDGYSFLATSEKYDPLTNSWIIGANMLIPKYCSSANVVNDKIYVIGGEGEARMPLSVVEEYDPIFSGEITKIDNINKVVSCWGAIKKTY